MGDCSHQEWGPGLSRGRQLLLRLTSPSSALPSAAASTAAFCPIVLCTLPSGEGGGSWLLDWVDVYTQTQLNLNHSYHLLATGRLACFPSNDPALHPHSTLTPPPPLTASTHCIGSASGPSARPEGRCSTAGRGDEAGYCGGGAHVMWAGQRPPGARGGREGYN